MSKDNTSGFHPYDVGVLVRIQPPEEAKTSGGIILPSSMDAVSIEAVQEGVVVEMADIAFTNRDGSKKDDAPKVGDSVLFIKYSGQFLYSHQTDDEQNYRIMDDHDIRLIRSREGS